MPTLYDQFPKEMELLAEQGNENLVLMSNHFDDAGDMAEALGYTRSAVNNWIHGRNAVAGHTERAAEQWMRRAWEIADLEAALEKLKAERPPERVLCVAKIPPEEVETARGLLAVLDVKLVEVK